MIKITVVIPCFNEEEVIEETAKRLINICSYESYEFEFLFVDDGSSDKTANIIKNLISKNNKIKLIELSRNFGHQNAVTAGIDYATGDAIVLIDADLQDPPDVILKMIDKWKLGFEVVYGTREQRSGESRFKIITAEWFYKILNFFSDVKIPLNTGDFRLMDRVVVDAIKNMPERDRFIRGMVSWVGFRQCQIVYKRNTRFAGKSKYPIGKMLKLAIDGIISFSTKPLKFATAFGALSGITAFTTIVYAIYMRLFTNTWIEGWTAMMIAILFIGGVQLFCIGILGEYIGRIYMQSKNRPLYFIKKKSK